MDDEAQRSTSEATQRRLDTLEEEVRRLRLWKKTLGRIVRRNKYALDEVARQSPRINDLVEELRSLFEIEMS